MSVVTSLKLSHESYLRPTAMKAELFVDANHRRTSRTCGSQFPALITRMSQRQHFQSRGHATPAIG